MGAKLTPRVILEGTRLTHKTDLAFALNRHPRIVGARKYEYPSPLISAEWCAFTDHPWGRGLINYDPAEEARAMETYATWARRGRSDRRLAGGDGRAFVALGRPCRRARRPTRAAG